MTPFLFIKQNFCLLIQPIFKFAGATDFFPIAPTIAAGNEANNRALIAYPINGFHALARAAIIVQIWVIAAIIAETPKSAGSEKERIPTTPIRPLAWVRIPTIATAPAIIRVVSVKAPAPRIIIGIAPIIVPTAPIAIRPHAIIGMIAVLELIMAIIGCAVRIVGIAVILAPIIVVIAILRLPWLLMAPIIIALIARIPLVAIVAVIAILRWLALLTTIAIRTGFVAISLTILW